MRGLSIVGVPLPDALFGSMDNDMGEKWLIFLTNWSMVFLGTYLWTAFAASLYTDHSPRLLQTVWVLRNCTAVAALVVSLLFWCVLFPAIKKTSWTDVHCHAVNSFLVLLDLTLTHVPYYFKHGWMPFLYLVLYLLFSVVYWAEGGTDPEGDPYIYEPLDYDHPGAATGLVLAVVFLVVPFVHVSLYAYTRCLSQGLCQACFGEGGKMGRREGARTDRLPLLPA